MGANEHRCWKGNEKWQRPVELVAVVFVIDVKAITVVVVAADAVADVAAAVADGAVVAVTLVAAAAAAVDVEPMLSPLPSLWQINLLFNQFSSGSLLCLLLSE